MGTVETEVLNVRVSADVKEKLAADAADRGASVNDVAVAILAERFGIRFEGTGRRGSGTHTSAGAILLRVPPALYRRVDAAAARRPRGSRTKVAVVEAVFREHYALDAVAA